MVFQVKDESDKMRLLPSTVINIYYYCSKLSVVASKVGANVNYFSLLSIYSTTGHHIFKTDMFLKSISSN